MFAVPASGAIKPSSNRTVVVLPAPFGPSNVKSLPSGISKERSSTAGTPSKKRDSIEALINKDSPQWS